MDFLGRVRSFLRVVEAGSLSAASRSMRVSLAAVSRQISSLENELGARLFSRAAKAVVLTAEGRAFHAHATRLVREADAALASVRPGRSISGNVTLSASVAMGVLRVVPALPELLRSHPGLRVDLRLEDREVDLIGEGVDIAVRVNLAPPDSTELVAKALASFPRFFVASPTYLRRRGTPRNTAALGDHEVLTNAAGSARWSFVEDGEARTLTLDPAVRVTTLLGLQAAAVAGLGIAVLPDFVVAADLAAGALEPLLTGVQLAPVTAHALHRSEMRGMPRIDAMVEHLRKTLPREGADAAPAVTRAKRRR